MSVYNTRSGMSIRMIEGIYPRKKVSRRYKSIWNERTSESCFLCTSPVYILITDATYINTTKKL
jgi:hypothetical protein